MPSSYEKVNYAVRPAKAMERKMLCESFQRLSEFGRLDRYRYIGFGSTYFTDFVLFHRVLGITNMWSIEADVDNKPRFDFNKPYKCIKMLYGWSNEALKSEELRWDVRTIAWLDYDVVLDESVLSDVRFLFMELAPGSIPVFTVDARPPDPQEEASASLREVKRRLRKRVPADVHARDLAAWGTAALYRRVIQNEIEQTLRDRNADRGHGEGLLYKQLYNFHYRDSVHMLTVGGILYDEGQAPAISKCDFEALPFIRVGTDPCVIEVPKLTLREVRFLDAQLPCSRVSMIKHPGLPAEDLKRYAASYRYFPTFTEAEL